MYKDIANSYDIFLNDKKFDTDLKMVVKLLSNKKHGVDLACGTGRYTIALKKSGFDIYGVDISTQMLQKASENAFNQNIDIKFICGDLQNFNFIKRPEFVTIMCDGINYVKSPKKALQHIYNSLDNNGILVFDISSEFKLTEIIANNTFTDSSDDSVYIWQNYLDTQKKCVEMHLMLFNKNSTGSFDKSEEKHIQYIHNSTDIMNMLLEIGYKNIKIHPKSDKKNALRVFFSASK